MFSIGLIAILVMVVMGCLCSNELETEPFPTYFVRESDGVQIYLGMSKGEAEQFGSPFLNSEPADVMFMSCDDDDVFAIFVATNYWVFAGEISVGDSIQSVIDNNEFSHINHNAELGRVTIYANLPARNSTYRLGFNYDEEGIINGIILAYIPKLNAWYEQREE